MPSLRTFPIKAFIKVYNEVVPTGKRLTKRDQKEKNEEYIEGIRLFSYHNIRFYRAKLLLFS